MATYQLRRRKCGDEMQWCAVANGRVYPFGGDEFGRETAERITKEGNESVCTFMPDATLTELVWSSEEM